VTHATARSQDASKYTTLSFSSVMTVMTRDNARDTVCLQDSFQAFRPHSVESSARLTSPMLAAPMRYAMTDTMHVAAVTTALKTMSATTHPGMETTCEGASVGVGGRHLHTVVHMIVMAG